MIQTSAKHTAERSPYSVTTPPDIALHGPPGTGKTSTIREIIKGHADTMDPGKIGGFTYRREMADELKRSAMDVIDDDLGTNHWFRTTHSACYRLLSSAVGGLTDDNIVTDEDIAEFCADRGYGWHGEDGQVAFEGDLPMSVGPKLKKARSWCMNVGLNPRDHWQKAPCMTARLIHAIEEHDIMAEFCEEYTEWQEEHAMYDFDDMLMEVYKKNLTPSIDVLIEDEFQDKTPLQVAIYNQWARRANEVIIAGDPCQSIYTHMGTDPTFMLDALELAEETRHLGTSYRLGHPVVDYATRILEDNTTMDVPEIDAAGDTSIERIDLLEYTHEYAEQHAGDECFHLFRANYHKPHATEVLRTLGVPYQDTGDGPIKWTPEMVDLFNAVCKAEAQATEGDDQVLTPITSAELSRDEASAFREALPSEAIRLPGVDVSHQRDFYDVVDPYAVAKLIRGRNPFNRDTDLDLDHLHSAEVKRLHRMYEARSSPASIGRRIGLDDRINGVDHVVSTIHAAKGDERDVVFLFDATTQRIKTESNAASEALIWYVGATRAAEKLYLVRDGRANYTTGVIPI